MNNFIYILFKSIFAGIFISIAGWCYLVNPILGMVLFCVGLIGVIKYEAKLYTGTAGFLIYWNDLYWLLVIIFGNIIGCAAIAAMSLCSPFALSEAATHIIEGRLANGWLNCGILAIGCGILMSFAVQYARIGNTEVYEHFSNWLPLIFAVPAFILCGFPHCIADAFYSFVYLFNNGISYATSNFFSYYGSIVVGNFIGCNLYKAFIR